MYQPDNDDDFFGDAAQSGEDIFGDAAPSREHIFGYNDVRLISEQDLFSTSYMKNELTKDEPQPEAVFSTSYMKDELTKDEPQPEAVCGPQQPAPPPCTPYGLRMCTCSDGDVGHARHPMRFPRKR